MKVTILAGDLDREADNGEVTITEDTPSESVESDETTSAPTSTVVDNTPESEQIWHIVEDGDLVGAIAIRYGTSVSKLKELNPELNVDRISIGQRIRVK
ncbi:MAG: LysM peptidoglycan-binding domain-containing protein [Alistipes sp.]|nr:LysM peptidoglycan-binding domain-containing protein [Alistipes sp.]